MDEQKHVSVLGISSFSFNSSQSGENFPPNNCPLQLATSGYSIFRGGREQRACDSRKLGGDEVSDSVVCG